MEQPTGYVLAVEAVTRHVQLGPARRAGPPRPAAPARPGWHPPDWPPPVCCAGSPT